MFTDIHKSGERLLWFGEGVWAELYAAWGTSEYKKKREQNKHNRASDCDNLGTSLHTGGSVSYTEHRRKLKQMLGRDPTTIKLHTRTHQRQEGQGSQTDSNKFTMNIFD